MNRLLPRALMAPAVVTLFLWMIVPLVMTIYFSVVRYNLMQPGPKDLSAWRTSSTSSPTRLRHPSVLNTLLLLGSVIAITVILGVALALLVNEPLSRPRHRARAADLALFRHAHGQCAAVEAHDDEPGLRRARAGLRSSSAARRWTGSPTTRCSRDPDGGLAVAAFRLPDLHHLLQILDRDQMEAAGMDGANALQKFWFLTLPHLGRPIAVGVMIEMIFLLSVFAEIFTTTGGGPGNASTNVAFLIFKQALMNFDVGVASAGALFAVVLANIAAVFLIRMIGKNLD
jgi:sorbitol/mannitol transport system permease protein